MIDGASMTSYPVRLATIPDTEYEQVIAERYLFTPYANESTVWPVLHRVHSAWQVVSLPRYHSQASNGVWLLAEIANATGKNGFLQMSWMSLHGNGTLESLAEIDVRSNRSILVVSHDENIASEYTAALISPDKVQLILCDRFVATICQVTQVIFFPSILANTSRISAGLFVADLGHAGWLYIAADSGLHGLDLSTLIITPYLNGISDATSSLAWSFRRQTIFVGTATKLWIQQYASATEEWRFEHINGLIDAPITSLVYDDVQDKLWIGQDTGITLLSPLIISTGRLHWFFTRLAGQISNPGSDIGHLPFANITRLGVGLSRSPDGCVWLGAVRGVMRFNPNSTNLNAWRVFNSARYMPNRESLVNVSSLAVLSRDDDAASGQGCAAVVITSKGLTVLRFEMWTLNKKAEYFQSFLLQPGRHNKYGLVSSCSMSSWGDSRTCIKGPDDNDGLWTSMYLASQAFRYAVVKDPSVKLEAWGHFGALELLNQVSGISGYPGRSFAKRSDFPPDPAWYLSPFNATLQFKGDTSSDEIVGHEFVYPLVHDLLASTEEEYERPLTLLLNITNHILTHDWYLIGENHNHTTWGIWNPNQVNDDGFYQETRGLNSLQILAFLIQSYAYSDDDRFMDGAELLIESFHYDFNLINQKIIAACDNSFSDDELAYLSYFTLSRAFYSISSSSRLSTIQKRRAQLLIERLIEYMIAGLDLSHRYKQMEKSPFYNSIYCYATGQTNETQQLFKEYISRSSLSAEFDCQSLSNDGIWYLQRWPLELIDWPQYNSDRLDVQRNFPAECSGTRSCLQMLPPDERSTHKWNSGVYDLDDGNGLTEEDPTSFLLSYWAMRYLNLLA